MFRECPVAYESLLLEDKWLTVIGVMQLSASSQFACVSQITAVTWIQKCNEKELHCYIETYFGCTVLLLSNCTVHQKCREFSFYLSHLGGWYIVVNIVRRLSDGRYGI